MRVEQYREEERGNQRYSELAEAVPVVDRVWTEGAVPYRWHEQTRVALAEVGIAWPLARPVGRARPFLLVGFALSAH